MTDYKDFTASLLNKRDFVGNGTIFRHDNKLFFLTAGHCIYGKNFDLKPNIIELKIQTENNKLFKPLKIVSSYEFANEYDLGLIEVEATIEEIEKFKLFEFTTRPNNDKVDVFFRGNQKTSLLKYTYKEDLKFCEIDVSNEYRFDVKIKSELLIDNVGRKGSDWMMGFSGSMLFSDKTSKLFALGILIEIPNNGNNSQIKFSSLEPLKSILSNITFIDFVDVPKQYKRKKDLNSEELKLFDFNFKFDDSYYLSRQYEFIQQSSDFISFDVFDQNKSSRTLNDLYFELDNNHLVFILGNPGIGKTMELQNITYTVMNNKDYLAKYYKINNFTITDTIERYFNYSNYCNFDEILFVLDGIDEIPNPKDFLSKLDQFISTLKELGRKHKFIISCRSNIYNNIGFRMSAKSKILKIKGLPFESSINLLQKLIDIELTEIELKHLSLIEEFLSNPTKLKLVANYYKEKGKIETNIAILWGTYISSRLKNDKNDKRNKLEIIIPRLKLNATKFALLNELTQKASLNEDELFRLILFGESYNELINCPFIDCQMGISNYYFEDKEIQEYLVAKFISEKNIDYCIKFLSIQGTNIFRPTLLNVFTFLINILNDQSEKFKMLLVWLKENSPELLIKADIERVHQFRQEIFQNIFRSEQIDKTLWVGTNSSYSTEELAHFGNIQENFYFLLKIIQFEKKNPRARISALNLLENFTVFDHKFLLEKSFEIINSTEEEISFKSSLIRMLIGIGVTTESPIIEELLETFKDDSNKELNRSLLEMLQNIENIDPYFDYLQKEFNWEHKIIPRKESDDTIRGNSWVLMSLILKLKDPDHFLELAIHYFDDYKLRADDLFRENLIKRFVHFQNKNKLFIEKLLERLNVSDNHRNRYNEEILSDLIKLLNVELIAFQKLFDTKSFNVTKWFLGKICNKETIDFLIPKIISDKDSSIHELQAFRNILYSNQNRESAIYFEDELLKNKVSLGERLPSQEDIDANKIIQQLEVQQNFDLLFDNESLIKKIKFFFTDRVIDKLNTTQLRQIEREFYDEKQNWFRNLNIEFDILYSITYSYELISLEETIDILNNSKRIHLLALKLLIESNKNKPIKFEINAEKKKLISSWLTAESIAFDFDQILINHNHNGYSFKSVDAKRTYDFLKKLYYFFEIPEYTKCFSQDFLINSLVYYHMEEYDPISEKFFQLINLIENKELLNQQIVKILGQPIFSFPAERMMVYSLKNNLSTTFPKIKSYLLQSSSIYSSDKLFQLYLKATLDTDILEELSNDLSTSKGWEALKFMSDYVKFKEICEIKSIKYIEGGQSEFTEKALLILFKLNSYKAIEYYIEFFQNNPLGDYAQRYTGNYHLAMIKLTPILPVLFELLYSKKYTDDDWSFTTNHQFLFSLVNQSILKSGNHHDSFINIKMILATIIKDIKKDDDNYDRKLFYANTLIDGLEKNYINAMSKPLEFEEALTLTNDIFS
jgi:hypothetical protein